MSIKALYALLTYFSKAVQKKVCSKGLGGTVDGAEYNSERNTKRAHSSLGHMSFAGNEREKANTGAIPYRRLKSPHKDCMIP